MGKQHHAILGLKHRGDGDTRGARKALFIFMPPINCRFSNAGAATVDDGE